MHAQLLCLNCDLTLSRNTLISYQMCILYYNLDTQKLYDFQKSSLIKNLLGNSFANIYAVYLFSRYTFLIKIWSLLNVILVTVTWKWVIFYYPDKFLLSSKYEVWWKVIVVWRFLFLKIGSVSVGSESKTVVFIFFGFSYRLTMLQYSTQFLVNRVSYTTWQGQRKWFCCVAHCNLAPAVSACYAINITPANRAPTVAADRPTTER